MIIIIGMFEERDHVALKTGTGELIASEMVPGGFMTNQEDWRTVCTRFDVERKLCDVELDGVVIMEQVSLPQTFVFPKRLCVAVCAAATDPHFMIAVNNVTLEDG